MTPVYLSSPPSSFPLLERQEDQARALHLLLSPYPGQPSSSSLVCTSFPNTVIPQDQGDDQGPSLVKPEASSDHKVVRVWGSSNSDFLASPSSSFSSKTRMAAEEEEGHGSNFGMGWVSSKMRFMQKIRSNPNCTSPTERNKIKASCDDGGSTVSTVNGGNHTIRVCSDCNTTTTPLWRSGPRGPKSLCNACGIRQRKARRAMEEAAMGFDPSSLASARINSKVHGKEKKPRAGHTMFGQTCKKSNRAGEAETPARGSGEKEGLFGDFSAFRHTFPQDETEAAILLMELSCGFAHT